MSQQTISRPADEEEYDTGGTIFIILAPLVGLVASCLCCACCLYYFGEPADSDSAPCSSHAH